MAVLKKDMKRRPHGSKGHRPEATRATHDPGKIGKKKRVLARRPRKGGAWGKEGGTKSGEEVEDLYKPGIRDQQTLDQGQGQKQSQEAWWHDPGAEGKKPSFPTHARGHHRRRFGRSRGGSNQDKKSELGGQKKSP